DRDRPLHAGEPGWRPARGGRHGTAPDVAMGRLAPSSGAGAERQSTITTAANARMAGRPRFGAVTSKAAARANKAMAGRSRAIAASAIAPAAGASRVAS